ncbi:MAG: Gfo/Idh/MocA family oxidoreductase [Planctomycetota bacterium]
MNRPLRMAVIGTGHLGRHHARNLSNMANVELVGISDPDRERGLAAAELSGATWFADPSELPEDLDAVSIAAPTPLHHDLAEKYLRRGIHCLVEKPMTATSAQAVSLCRIAEESGCVLQVGHIERFNPVLDGLTRPLPRPLQLDGWRLAPHSGRSTDTSVVFDLMIHDIDLALWFANSKVDRVEARGGVLIGPLPDWAVCRLTFESGTQANLTASRIAPTVERRMILHLNDGTLDIDFGKRALGTFGPGGVATFQGSEDEPLRRELEHFVARVRAGERPLVSWDEGRLSVEIASEVLYQLAKT